MCACVCVGRGGGALMAGYLQCVLKMMGQLNWWKGDPGEQLGEGVQLDVRVQLDAEVQLDEQTLCLTLLV